MTKNPVGGKLNACDRERADAALTEEAMAELRRRCRVEAPDLSVAGFDLTNKVSDLRNRIGHALRLFGEPIPFVFNALVLVPHPAIRFERLQRLGPFRKLRRGFLQTVPFERGIEHLATRELQVIA